MKKIKIAVVSSSENFALQINDKLKERTGDNSEIFIITQKNYIAEFFSQPQKIDVLLIENNLYSDIIEKNNIDLICVLKDSPDDCQNTKTGYVYNIYKGAGIEKIVETMLSTINPAQYSGDADSDGCKVVLVTSPIGGSGKTLVSSAIAQCLSKNGMRVLYADTTCFQSASYWMKNASKTSDEFILDNFSANTVGNIIEHDGVDHIAFFSQILPALSINAEDYYGIIKAEKFKNNYDYIVVDSESCFTEGLINIMSLADYTVVLALQDEFSVFKLKKFLSSFDCSGNSGYILCCNKYCIDKKNYLKGGTETLPVSVCIPMFDTNGADLSDVCSMKCIHRIVSNLF